MARRAEAVLFHDSLETPYGFMPFVSNKNLHSLSQTGQKGSDSDGRERDYSFDRNAAVAASVGLRKHKAITMNDKQLQQAVTDELAWEPSVMSEHIGVTAREGIVTLSGHVPSYWEKCAAQAAATRVKGVKAVVEEVKVKLFGDNIWEDDKIAERAVHNLAFDSSVPKDKVKLTVEKGWITLTGEVDWNYQKTAADHAVHRLIGVLGVTNDIKIKPHVTAYEVREKIETALSRVASFEAQDLSINIEGGKVTLGGKLDNWHERDLAETAAWSVPGVTQVQDRISLNW
jgi:osmotically-inducible protein OsmY